MRLSNMLAITLRMSESLLSIYRDSGTPMKEIIRLKTEPGTTVLEVIAHQGISPLLVPMVAMTTQTGTKRIDKNTPLEKDVELTLYGPLAGG